MTVPTGVPNQVTYKLTGISRFETLAELPLNGLTFSRVLCGSGPWSATLNANDRGVQRANWIAATSPWRAALWVDIDGVLVYGGPVTSRVYASNGIATLSGFDFAGYLSQRLQHRDYTSYEDPEGHRWNSEGGGSPAMSIAYYVLRQALSVADSIPIKVSKSEANAPETFFINFSAPIEQSRTLAAVLSELQELGYQVGFDYTVEYAYADGSPTVEIALWYPRREAAALPVFDLDNALDYSWPEDGTQTANRIVEIAGATTDRTGGKEFEPAAEAGYPLLETTISHPALAPTAEGNRAQLEAYASSDLSSRAFPFVVPSVTVPLLGSPSIKSLEVGGNAGVRALRHSGGLPPTCPRFPSGLDTLQRVVRVDATVLDEGVSTMTVAFNPPPTRVPVEPAETRTGGGPPAAPEKWVEREKEREESEEKESEDPIAKEAEVIAQEAIEKTGLEKTRKEAEAIKKRARKSKSTAESEAIKSEAEEVRKRSEGVRMFVEFFNVEEGSEEATGEYGLGTGEVVVIKQTPGLPPVGQKAEILAGGSLGPITELAITIVKTAEGPTPEAKVAGTDVAWKVTLGPRQVSQSEWKAEGA